MALKFITDDTKYSFILGVYIIVVSVVVLIVMILNISVYTKLKGKILSMTSKSSFQGDIRDYTNPFRPKYSAAL